MRQALGALTLAAMMIAGAFIGASSTPIFPIQVQDPGVLLVRNVFIGAGIGLATGLGIQRIWSRQKRGYVIIGGVIVVCAYLLFINLPFAK